MNSSNVIALRSGSSTPAVRDIDREDLYVEFLRHHRGHIQRRKDRQDAHRRAVIREREDREQRFRDLTLLSQFTTLGVVVVLGLML